jgi:hypothetical protein
MAVIKVAYRKKKPHRQMAGGFFKSNASALGYRGVTQR